MAGEVSLSETLADLYDKITGGASIAVGMIPPFGRFQLATQDVRGAPVKVFKNLPPALRSSYRYFMKQHGPREWLIYENERITFEQGRQMFEALGAELGGNRYQIKKGEKVGICMRNYPEFMISFLGITAMGSVAVPLNSLWKTQELEYAVSDSDCKVLIMDPERFEVCKPFLTTKDIKVILVRGDKSLAESISPPAELFSDVVARGKDKKIPKVPMDSEDEAMIMYTSGSTGFPKGVVHTQRGVGTALKLGELATCLANDPIPKALMAVPLFHITALSPIGLFSIPAGGTIIFMRKWDAGKALQIIEKEKVTRFTGVPTMVRDMLEHKDFDPKKIRSMKNMLAGGAPVPPSQVGKMRAKAKRIKSGQGYGLTETMAFAAAINGTDYVKHPTSCGRPLPLLIEIKIKDPKTGKEVKEGERGEVCIRSAMVMKCYHNKPEATTKAIDSEGFFHSGDIGKMEGGLLYLLDRMKDLIIRGGENIDCSEVEAAIASHPAAREISVFALPDARLGEVVGAAIWVTDQSTTKEELSENSAKHLAKFKVPLPENIFLHHSELPKGATGKIDKKGLREKYSQQVKDRPIQARL